VASSGIGCQSTFTDTMKVDPQATLAFGINKTGQCLRANQKFIFTDSSKVTGSSIKTYKWTTGDGRTSSRTDSIQHTYATANTFQVSLFTETLNGCLDTLRKNVTVYPMPVVSYTINNASQCLKNNNFAFTDKTTLASGSISSRLWSFGNKAKNTSTATNPTFTYDTAQAFAVKLIVTSALGCKDSATQTLNVRPMPKSIIFRSSRDTQCFNGNVFRFVDTSTIASGSVTRQWTFGDGVGSSTLPRPSYTYKTDGVFTVMLALNSVTFNCKDTARRTVMVSPKPKARIFIDDSLQCLNGNRFRIIDTSTVKSPWKIDSSYFSFGASQSSKSKRNNISYTAYGTYTINLITRTNFGCRDTLNSKLTVYPMPQPAIGLLTIDSQCLKGNRFDFSDNSTVPNGHKWKPLWNFGNKKIDTAGTSKPIHRYLDTGKYTVTLRIRTDVGCMDSVKKTVVVHPQSKVAFSFQTSKTQCLTGNRFIVQNNSSISRGTISYAWDLGNGRKPTRSDTVQAVYGNFGAYAIKLFTTSNFGCKDTLIDTARVSATPGAKFWVANKKQCLKNSFAFRDTSSIGAGKISSYKWYFGNGDSSSLRHPVYRYKAPGTYVVRFIVGSGTGCSSSFVDTVQVYPQALLTFGINKTAQCLRANQKFIFTDTSRITGSTFKSYLWTMGDTRNSNRTDSVQHTYANAGTYQVSLFTETNNGCKDTLRKSVTVYPMPMVSFTVNSNSQCLKANRFIFTDKTTISTGVISSRFWTFGNKAKNTSTLTNPSFVYDTAMAYNVKLIATSGFGCKDSATQTMNVRPMPKSVIFHRTKDTQCLGGNVFRFTDTSGIASGTFNRQWSFGDGVGSSTSKWPSYSYAADGNFIVRLALNSDFQCKDTASKTITVTPMPVVSIKASSASLCERQDTGVFTAISAIKNGTLGTAKWYFGNGDSAVGSTVRYLYKKAGTYTLTLWVNSGVGCRSTATMLINVRNKPALGLTQSKSQYCVNDSLIIDLSVTRATAPITYSWTGPNSYKATTQDVV
jgi:PKD repeat protein